MIGAACLLGFGRREVLIDGDDIDSLGSARWRLHVARKTSGADYVYVARKSAGKVILLHRVIAGAPQGFVVDHLNGNRLDNRRANLRVCTHAENMQNRKINVDNTSGYKGVYWSTSNRGWVARISRKYIGTFASPELAALAYEAEARKRFSHLA